MSGNVKELLGKVRQPQQPIMRSSVAQDADEDYVPVGLGGLVAAGKKLLAVNRKLIPEDDRDSFENKTFLTTDKLMRERIRMDSGKLRLNTLRRISKAGNLKSLSVGHFDDWTRGMIVGHQLSSPLEEINPMHLIEQARRVTSMGPGGIGSSDAITTKAQAVHASQFGYVSPIEGPESEMAGIDKRLANGVHFGSDGNLYQQMRNAKTGKIEWVSHVQAASSRIKIPD